MSEQIRINGLWVSTIGGWGDLTWSSTADAGSEQASWKMDLPPTFNHPAMTAGKVVEIRVGPANVWRGTLSEPKNTAYGWDFSAVGIAGEGRSYLCLDAGGNTTSTPNVAIDQAIARGLPWTRPTSLSAVPFAQTDDTDKLNYVTDLLDAWAKANSVRWWVDPDGAVRSGADTTVPDWYMTPGSGRIGRTDDDYASNLYVRYKSSATSYATATVSDATASAQHRREYPVDATSLGVITAIKAGQVGSGLFARGKARYAWTEAVNPSALQLTTPGGTPAYLPFVKAGQMVRLHGVRNEQGVPLPHYDFVIGRSEYPAGADTITLAPVNMAERNLGDVLAVAVGQ